jgi:hypothetical protein
MMPRFFTPNPGFREALKLLALVSSMQGETQQQIKEPLWSKMQWISGDQQRGSVDKRERFT